MSDDYLGPDFYKWEAQIENGAFGEPEGAMLPPQPVPSLQEFQLLLGAVELGHIDVRNVLGKPNSELSDKELEVMIHYTQYLEGINVEGLTPEQAAFYHEMFPFDEDLDT